MMMILSLLLVLQGLGLGLLSHHPVRRCGSFASPASLVKRGRSRGGDPIYRERGGRGEGGSAWDGEGSVYGVRMLDVKC